MTNDEAIGLINDMRNNAIGLMLEKKQIDALDMAIEALMSQAPRPVESDIDRTWGIHKKVPVCPRCESYLTIMHFIGDGKKVSYCEHCGQAVSWEEWKYEE